MPCTYIIIILWGGGRGVGVAKLHLVQPFLVGVPGPSLPCPKSGPELQAAASLLSDKESTLKINKNQNTK